MAPLHSYDWDMLVSAIQQAVDEATLWRHAGAHFDAGAYLTFAFEALRELCEQTYAAAGATNDARWVAAVDRALARSRKATN